KEGETGRRKIQEWTRYVTVPLCVVQAIFWISYMHNAELVQSTYAHTFTFWIMSVFGLTAGCVFLMWLGEQIDEYGLGNGISLIILAGIVARVPSAVVIVYSEAKAEQVPGVTFGKIVFLILSFIFVVA